MRRPCPGAGLVWQEVRQALDEAAERFQMPYEQGLCHEELGRHAAPDDPGRQVHLARARALFARVGLPTC